jgi:hypothetical protein
MSFSEYSSAGDHANHSTSPELVTIITPTFRATDTITATVRSVLAQSSICHSADSHLRADEAYTVALKQLDQSGPGFTTGAAMELEALSKPAALPAIPL